LQVTDVAKDTKVLLLLALVFPPALGTGDEDGSMPAPHVEIAGWMAHDPGTLFGMCGEVEHQVRLNFVPPPPLLLATQTFLTLLTTEGPLVAYGVLLVAVCQSVLWPPPATPFKALRPSIVSGVGETPLLGLTVALRSAEGANEEGGGTSDDEESARRDANLAERSSPSGREVVWPRPTSACCHQGHWIGLLGTMASEVKEPRFHLSEEASVAEMASLPAGKCPPPALAGARLPSICLLSGGIELCVSGAWQGCL
jgi:hypothetical protein